MPLPPGVCLNVCSDTWWVECESLATNNVEDDRLEGVGEVARTVAAEVIVVERERHHAAKFLIHHPLAFDRHRLEVVVRDPLEVTIQVRHLGHGIEHSRGVGRLQALTDFVVDDWR